MPARLRRSGSLLSFGSTLRPFFRHPGFPRLAGGGVLPGESDAGDLGVRHPADSFLRLRKDLDGGYAAARRTVEVIAYERLPGSQFQRHVAAVVKGRLQRLGELGRRCGAKDAPLKD